MHHGHRHGFSGRRYGFPSRPEWLEHLQRLEARLEQDLANVRELIERLRDAPAQTGV